MNYPARFYPDLDDTINEMAGDHNGVDSGIGLGVRDLDYFYEGENAGFRAIEARDRVINGKLPIKISKELNPFDDLDAIFVYVRELRDEEDLA